MQRITPGRPWPLFGTAATRSLERRAAAALAPHTLMQRAGLAVARVALALAPHARTIWIACGPGNNGGDGYEAAMHLALWGKKPLVTWPGDESRLPPDARMSWQRAREAGVLFVAEAPDAWDLGIDALLGLGVTRAPDEPLLHWIGQLNAGPAPVLAIDLPCGLDADTGQGAAVRARHTLSLLTLKPGLFTGSGRDAAAQVWFDDLGVDSSGETPTALLAAPEATAARLHASHKGSRGDVAVIGGAPGMTGAALLAASAALYGGAGRVFVGLLDDAPRAADGLEPELMFRPWKSLDVAAMSVACGCGGGEAVRSVLHRVLSTAPALVLDADGLNAIAADTQLQALLRARSARTDRCTVLTPHPLEAARLLGSTTGQVQAGRLAAAGALAERFACCVVLKGSGTVISAPGRPPAINPTGNGRLATAGTGDVLAGMIAARLASGTQAFEAACHAVYAHGLAADQWPTHEPLTAGTLARRA
jgi:hydroxyethylthiazole kinase-like uncharacterized protein yjeF